jgi:hypothetical protein
MWFEFLFPQSKAARTKTRSNPTSPRLTVEALNDRILPSAVVPVPLAADTALVGPVSTQQQTLDVDGTFSVTNVHGSSLSATAEGNLVLDGGPPLHFTIDAHVKDMGNHIVGTPTMVFDDGSTLTFSYEIKVDRDTGIFEGEYQITGGTGQFQGASGAGEICYPIGFAGPLMMDGTLNR